MKNSYSPSSDPFLPSIKENREPEPLKYRFMDAIGLKQYLIQPVLLSSIKDSTYQIIEQDGRKRFSCAEGIQYPDGYTVDVRIIEDGNHSVPTVILSMMDRSKYSGTVIYSHGNNSDLGNSLRFISAFTRTLPRFDYIVYDYTGYGCSAFKETTQQTIFEDLQLVLRSIKVPIEDVILWGFSLGAYPSVRVAKGKKLRGVLLQSPLASVYSLSAQELTPYSTFQNDSFSLLEHLPKVDCFLVIAHSHNDQSIPFLHSKVLFQRYQILNPNPFCFLFQVEGLGHNQMHPLLTSPNKNHIRDSFHNYFKLMTEQALLPTVRLFQLQKSKYFSNLGDLKQARPVDVGDKVTVISTPHGQIPPADSYPFGELKRERSFELDDVGEEERVQVEQSLEVKADQHARYFQRSQEAIDETEVDSILSEQNIPNILE